MAPTAPIPLMTCRPTLNQGLRHRRRTGTLPWAPDETSGIAGHTTIRTMRPRDQLMGDRRDRVRSSSGLWPRSWESNGTPAELF